MSAATALAELMESPLLPDHVAELQAKLQEERRRRECFIDEIDESMKAEFINGEVIIHSPARLIHAEVVKMSLVLLDQYVTRHDLGTVLMEKVLIRCHRNDYEPDVCFFQTAKTEGWKPDLKIFPPPDLIAEVLSPSTERHDRTIKFQDYAAHGVNEYWIIDADARVIEQYLLPPGATAYTLHAHVEIADRLVSPTIHGFDVPAVALFDAHENQRALMALFKED